MPILRHLCAITQDRSRNSGLTYFMKHSLTYPGCWLLATYTRVQSTTKNTCIVSLFARKTKVNRTTKPNVGYDCYRISLIPNNRYLHYHNQERHSNDVSDKVPTWKYPAVMNLLLYQVYVSFQDLFRNLVFLFNFVHIILWKNGAVRKLLLLMHSPADCAVMLSGEIFKNTII